MPDLVEKATGQTRFVPPERVADAISSGLFEAPAGDQSISVTLPGALHLAGEVPVADLARSTQQGGTHIETEDDRRARERTARLERQHGGAAGKVATVLENAVDTASLGLGGIAMDHLGGEEYREGRLERSEANPISAGIGTAAGVLATLPAGGEGLGAELAASTPLGKFSAIAGDIARGGEEGASLLSRTGRVLGAGAIEGAGQGFGMGVQELNNSTDPLTIERVGSTLSSNVLFGAGLGAGAAGAGKVLEKGLRKGSELLGEYAASAGKAATGEIPEEFASMTAKELKGAREAEEQAIEAARVPERAKLTEDLAAFRKELKDQKVFLATKGAEDTEIRVIGKQTLDADRQLDRLLNNPKNLASKPEKALEALQKQEHALEQLSKKADELRESFDPRNIARRDVLAGNVPGEVGPFNQEGLERAVNRTMEARHGALEVTAPTTRHIALDNALAALDKNRALQQRIAELTAAPRSARLTALDDAKDALMTGRGKGKTLLERVAEGGAYTAVAGAVSTLPGGHLVAPFLGARAAEFVTGKLGAKLGEVTREGAVRMSKAVAKFADVTKRAAPALPVLATRTLKSVSFSDAKKPEPEAPARKGKKKAAAPKETLASLYKARSEEVRSQTAFGPDGKAVVKPEVRQRMAKKLDAVRAVDPIMADRLESQAVARMQYYANALPRRPDYGVIQTGPDTWQPPDMEMRRWARIVAAGEDVHAVMDRMSDGSITPEDAAVMRDLCPEQLAMLTQQVLVELPKLQKTLPYNRRLSLTMLTGVPVDPSMHPRVLSVLQSAFTEEPGTSGGMEAPRPAPQFGSVKIDEATPAQKRSEG